MDLSSEDKKFIKQLRSNSESANIDPKFKNILLKDIQNNLKKENNFFKFTNIYMKKILFTLPLVALLIAGITGVYYISKTNIKDISKINVITVAQAKEKIEEKISQFKNMDYSKSIIKTVNTTSNYNLENGTVESKYEYEDIVDYENIRFYISQNTIDSQNNGSVIEHLFDGRTLWHADNGMKMRASSEIMFENEAQKKTLLSDMGFVTTLLQSGSDTFVSWSVEERIESNKAKYENLIDLMTSYDSDYELKQIEKNGNKYILIEDPTFLGGDEKRIYYINADNFNIEIEEAYIMINGKSVISQIFEKNSIVISQNDSAINGYFTIKAKWNDYKYAFKNVLEVQAEEIVIKSWDIAIEGITEKYSDGAYSYNLIAGGMYNTGIQVKNDGNIKKLMVFNPKFTDSAKTLNVYTQVLNSEGQYENGKKVLNIVTASEEGIINFEFNTAKLSMNGASEYFMLEVIDSASGQKVAEYSIGLY